MWENVFMLVSTSSGFILILQLICFALNKKYSKDKDSYLEDLDILPLYFMYLNQSTVSLISFLYEDQQMETKVWPNAGCV